MKRLVALLGWVGVALVAAAVVLWALRPELETWRRGLALGGLAVTILYALTQWRDIARSFGGREVKYGSVAVTSVLLLVAIVVGVNWTASRQNKRWDLTTASQFSLSDQTQQILRGLDRPVTFRVFYVGSPAEHRDRLTEYGYYSSQVHAEYIDAERNPLDAQRYEIQSVPTILVEYDGRTERILSSSEQTLTNALKRVIEGTPKKVYFLQGHGEADPAGTDGRGLSTIADALRNDNFQVEPLPLAQQGAVPADATVIVVAGPKTDVLPAEGDALRAFLRRGGKLQLLLDPPERGTAPDVTSLIALAREWGMDVGNNLVIDNSSLGQQLGTGPSVPIAMPMPHPITEGFRLMTAFPVARSVTTVDGGADGRFAQPFLQTSPQSWAEVNLSELYGSGTAELNPDRGDIAGPITLAAAVSAAAEEPPAAPTPAEGDADGGEAPGTETRVVVVGDSDFATNAMAGMRGNQEIFLNMVNWLAQQDDLIAIRPVDPENRPITLSAAQGMGIFWFVVVALPLLIFANGVRVWWRRR